MIEKQLIDTVVLIVAAGVSNRLPGNIPKQYMYLYLLKTLSTYMTLQGASFAG